MHALSLVVYANWTRGYFAPNFRGKRKLKKKEKKKKRCAGYPLKQTLPLEPTVLNDNTPFLLSISRYFFCVYTMYKDVLSLKKFFFLKKFFAQNFAVILDFVVYNWIIRALRSALAIIIIIFFFNFYKIHIMKHWYYVNCNNKYRFCH